MSWLQPYGTFSLGSSCTFPFNSYFWWGVKEGNGQRILLEQTHWWWVQAWWWLSFCAAVKPREGIFGSGINNSSVFSDLWPFLSSLLPFSGSVKWGGPSPSFLLPLWSTFPFYPALRRLCPLPSWTTQRWSRPPASWPLWRNKRPSLRSWPGRWRRNGATSRRNWNASGSHHKMPTRSWPTAPSPAGIR